MVLDFALQSGLVRGLVADIRFSKSQKRLPELTPAGSQPSSKEYT